MSGVTRRHPGQPRQPCSRAALIILSSVLFSGGLRGQTGTVEAISPDPPAQKDLTDLSIEQLMEIEVRTVQSASRYEQKVSEAPASVTIVTSDDIKKFGYRTLADILRSIPGLYVTYDRNYYYLGARGFGIPGDYNTRVLVLIDGHRLNDNVYDEVLVGTEFILDVDLIEKVEFVRGPGSSLYGSNAFFGVVNVITRKAKDVGLPEVSAAAGSFGTYKGRVSLGKELESGLSFLFSGSILGSEGQDLHFKEFDDPSTGSGWARNVDGELAYDLFSKISFRDLTLMGAFNSRKKEVPTGSYGTVFGSSQTKTTDARAFVDLKYEHEFKDVADVTARIYYDGYYYWGDYLFDYSETDEPFLVLNKDVVKGDWWGTEVQLTREFLQRLKVALGAEYRDNLRQSQRNFDDNPHYVYLDKDKTSAVYGAFLQGDLKILESLRLNAGVRYDYYTIFGDSVNPRAGLMYSPLEETSLKLLFGRAFRAPNVYELYYDDATTAKANPDLDAENIYTYELVWEQEIQKHLRLTAAGFHYDIDDLIVQETDPADDLMVFRNVGEVESNGVEVALSGRWASGLRGRISYAFQRTENKETDDVLVNSPAHMAKLNIVLPIYEDKFFSGIELQYLSSRKTVMDRHTPDVLLANLTFFSRELCRGLEFSASVYNLFNWKYSDPGGLEQIQDTIEQDGINFRLKLTYRF